ncbi:type I DNA topoisomerase, partial [bacterium]|nr:type I DNA topoisomerase [bacterium]
MSKFLVIVESPTKAKTINRFLGDNYIVKNSLGHVRDLPASKLGVDVKNNFQPTYQIIKGKSKVIKELQKIVKNVDKVYIATDQDREGEAIGWHLIESISIPSKKIKRIVFHEITKQAIENAVKNPRQIDMHLINAQQARRILDRLVGYKLSPLLAKKIRRGLSAGRVQSIALRLIVDREKEIGAFKAQEYWTIKASLKKQEEEELFNALLIAKQGKKYDKLGIANEKQALEITEDLSGAIYKVSKINKKEKKQRPLPPFTTSTLQQEAWQKLSFSAKRTMVIAQQLYEGISLGEKGNEGLITYMRTDSLNVAVSARKEANDYISEKYGKEYLPVKQRIYKTKSKGAQEAHEAIRPTSVFKAPEVIKEHLDSNQFKLYSLIWQRFLASQMADAILDVTAIDIQAKKYLFRASGQVVRFKGFN